MIKPARGYVLIEPKEAEEVSSGGVILPDRVKDMPQKGKVLDIGEIFSEGEPIPRDSTLVLLSKIQSSIKVGDTVIFKRFVDNRIKEDGKELLLVPFQDILGVIE